MIDQRRKENCYIVYDVACDFCSTGEADFEVESFENLLEEMGEKGWKTLYDRSTKTYMHECPDCIQAKIENIFK